MSQSPNERRRRGGTARVTRTSVPAGRDPLLSPVVEERLTPAEVAELSVQVMRAYDAIGQVTRSGSIGGTVLA